MRRNEVTSSTYSKIHDWLTANYGKATVCENKECKGKSKNYNWCLRRESKYDFKRENFVQMCRSCHAIYDTTEETRKKNRLANPRTHVTHCSKGHPFNEKNTILRDGKWRRCRICKSKINCVYKKKKRLINRQLKATSTT